MEDLLSELQREGGRVAPLFRVFMNNDSGHGLLEWRVCQVDSIGDPVASHSLHSTLPDALAEAARCNLAVGIVRPCDQREYSVYQGKPLKPISKISLTDRVLRFLSASVLAPKGSTEPKPRDPQIQS